MKSPRKNPVKNKVLKAVMIIIIAAGAGIFAAYVFSISALANNLPVAFAESSLPAASSAPASSLSVSVSAARTVDIGEPFAATVSLDTGGADINAVQGEISFPDSMFSIQSVSDGGSIVSFWIEPPKESSSGTIDFAGIIPGGFSGRTNLFSFIVSPLSAGSASINMAAGTVLKNDGEGTEIPVALSGAKITVGSANYSGPLPAAPTSTISPDQFTPTISRSDEIFNGQWFLAFHTTDEGTGIARYEVIEMPAGVAPGANSSWTVAQSPYLLKDQKLQSDIYVRAIDNAQNSTVAKIAAPHPPFRWNIAIPAAAIILVLVLLIIWFVRRRRRLKTS